MRREDRFRIDTWSRLGLFPPALACEATIANARRDSVTRRQLGYLYMATTWKIIRFDSSLMSY